jgi:hypothetical protein
VFKGKYVSPPIAVPPHPAGTDFGRANIQFEGVEQAGPAYEARVFLNNAGADANTPMTPQHGYAGSFHVYGLGVPLEGGPFAAAQAPISKSLVATEAVRAAASKTPNVTVTVIPVYPGTPPEAGKEPMKFDDVKITLE